ncbi:HBR383Wp [Eremothecium sinecaudum]|uniref:HBR383Wp n=1 Tax=Eremothecium sinecaudum TaxID=45286 RepID=A0A109UXG5_9SACH|nr:HBR383Wp [Eremothecium sinecaudum]AMD19284.1 HBR383Wp [Eremothecium sinecaudum]
MGMFRRRSNTAATTLSSKDNRTRLYSTSNDVLPQSLTISRSLGYDSSDPAPSITSTPPNINALQKLAGVGFQSILSNQDLRRSRNSVNSEVRPNNRPSQDIIQPIDSNNVTFKKQNNGIDKSSLQINASNLSLDLHSPIKSDVAVNRTLVRPEHAPKKKPSLKQATRRLLHIRGSSRKYKDNDIQQSSFGKFLFSPHGKNHRSHTTSNTLDPNRSTFSVKSQLSNVSDGSMKLPQESAFDTTETQMLYDLIKSMSSLESSFNQFTAQEQDALLGNIWGLYCNILLSVFRHQGVWQLPAKIEDINRVFKFYIRIKQEGKTFCQGSKFLTEIQDCLRNALYILETQVIYAHFNTEAIQGGIKRLCATWDLFYGYVLGDAMAVLAPLEVSFRYNPKYWRANQEDRILSVNQLLFQMFRDAVVIPSYQSLLDRPEGNSKAFQAYITEEEEKNGVTQADKLTLIQCFGLLASIHNNDANEKIVSDLLLGVRMSM